MAKTIQSRIHDADARKTFWEMTADDRKALEDRETTRQTALILASYFEGKAQGLREALSYIK